MLHGLPRCHGDGQAAGSEPESFHEPDREWALECSGRIVVIVGPDSAGDGGVAAKWGDRLMWPKEISIIFGEVEEERFDEVMYA